MSFFSGLPLELQTKVLQTIINTGASSLPLFLQAFPELSALVLLISDHVNSTEQLIEVPGLHAVDLEDHDTIARLRGTKPITILSFTKCDEEAAYGRLTRSPDCPYGRYMDCKSAVFVQLCGKALFGHIFIQSLAEFKDCSLGRQLVIEHHRHKVRGSHVEMAAGGSKRPAKLTISSPIPECLEILNYISEDPEIPWLVGLPFQKSAQYICWSKITDISIHCAWRIGSCERLPHLERIRISAPLALKCFDLKRLRGVGTACEFCCYGLAYAYRVKEVYYEFRASRTPVISSGPWTCCKITEADQFSFINLDWSEDDPTLSSSLCAHAQGSGMDYVQWSYNYMFQTPLTFLKIFNKITFIGIPDRIIILSKFSKTKKLIWKRLIPVNRSETVVTQPIIHCPSLETLVLATLLTPNNRTDPMPKINAPVIRSMDLCAVHGSNMAWTLGFHFTKETLASVQKVSMTAKHSDDSQVVPLTLKDLEPVSSNLESLSVVGYSPLFAMPMHEDLHGIVFDRLASDVFSKLATLDFDMGYFPLQTFPGQPRPLASVLLDIETFPVLKNLILNLSSRKRSPLLHDGVCNIRIQVTWSCQLLTVLKPLAANSFYVVREDEERCRGKRLTSGSFYAVVGKPAFMSTDLQVV